MSSFVEFILVSAAWSGSTILIVSDIPLLIKIFRTKEVAALSPLTLFLKFLGCMLLGTYALVNLDYPVVTSCYIPAFFIMLIIIFYYRYRNTQ